MLSKMDGFSYDIITGNQHIIRNGVISLGTNQFHIIQPRNRYLEFAFMKKK